MLLFLIKIIKNTFNGNNREIKILNSGKGFLSNLYHLCIKKRFQNYLFLTSKSFKNTFMYELLGTVQFFKAQHTKKNLLVSLGSFVS